jgi:hypothetical protein
MAHCTLRSLQRTFFVATLCAALFTQGVAHAQSLEWARAMGSPSQEIAYAVASDNVGSAITVGTFTLTVDLDPGPGDATVTSNGSSDVFIQKLDAEGNFLWGRSFGGTGADWGRGVAVDAQNNIVITGRVGGTVDLDPGPGTDVVVTPNTASAVYVIKLNAQGDYLWGRVFGGNSNDAGNDVAVDALGNIITVGLIGGLADLDPGPAVVQAGGNGQQDVFIQKLDANGLFVWGHAVGGTANDLANGVALDGAGNLFVTGEFRNTVDFDPGPGVVQRTSGGAEDIFLMKLDAGGVFQWAHGFGAAGSERARSVAVGPDGGPVFTGRITSVTDFDPGPGVFTLPGSNFEDAFLCKLDGSGNLAWAFMLATFLNEGMDVAVDVQNNIYLTGVFGTFSNLPLDLDPGPEVANIFNGGGGDGFLASYTGAGAFLWGFAMGSAQNDISNSVALASLGRIYVAGEFRQTIDMEPGPGISLLASAGGQDAFVARYNKPDCAGVFVQVKALLQGPHTPDFFLPMHDALRQAGLLPLQEPYSALGFELEEPATTTPQALSWTLSSAIVDWVLVELRDANDPAVVLRRRAALLQRDGDVVAVDGVSAVGFCIPADNYYVAVRHRNHLGVMTAAPVALGPSAVPVDFTLAATAVWGTEARHDAGDVQLLWQGNVVPDGLVKYLGATNDRDPILQLIGGTIPTGTVAGYWPEDANLDGVVKYVGTDNDRDRVLLTIGGSVITNVRMEQLP